MRFKWDSEKEKKISSERKINFKVLVEIFERSYHLSQKNDDPEQWRAIGWSHGRLITVIYEVRDDSEGIFFWFVTAWRSTSTERNLFNEA